MKNPTNDLTLQVADSGGCVIFVSPSPVKALLTLLTNSLALFRRVDGCVVVTNVPIFVVDVFIETACQTNA